MYCSVASVLCACVPKFAAFTIAFYDFRTKAKCYKNNSAIHADLMIFKGGLAAEMMSKERSDTLLLQQIRTIIVGEEGSGDSLHESSPASPAIIFDNCAPMRLSEAEDDLRVRLHSFIAEQLVLGGCGGDGAAVASVGDADYIRILILILNEICRHCTIGLIHRFVVQIIMPSGLWQANSAVEEKALEDVEGQKRRQSTAYLSDVFGESGPLKALALRLNRATVVSRAPTASDYAYFSECLAGPMDASRGNGESDDLSKRRFDPIAVLNRMLLDIVRRLLFPLQSMHRAGADCNTFSAGAFDVLRPLLCSLFNFPLALVAVLDGMGIPSRSSQQQHQEGAPTGTHCCRREEGDGLSPLLDVEPKPYQPNPLVEYLRFNLRTLPHDLNADAVHKAVINAFIRVGAVPTISPGEVGGTSDGGQHGYAKEGYDHHHGDGCPSAAVVALLDSVFNAPDEEGDTPLAIAAGMARQMGPGDAHPHGPSSGASADVQCCCQGFGGLRLELPEDYAQMHGHCNNNATRVLLYLLSLRYAADPTTSARTSSSSSSSHGRFVCDPNVWGDDRVRSANVSFTALDFPPARNGNSATATGSLTLNRSPSPHASARMDYIYKNRLLLERGSSRVRIERVPPLFLFLSPHSTVSCGDVNLAMAQLLSRSEEDHGEREGTQLASASPAFDQLRVIVTAFLRAGADVAAMGHTHNGGVVYRSMLFLSSRLGGGSRHNNDGHQLNENHRGGGARARGNGGESSSAAWLRHPYALRLIYLGLFLSHGEDPTRLAVAFAEALVSEWACPCQMSLMNGCLPYEALSSQLAPASSAAGCGAGTAQTVLRSILATLSDYGADFGEMFSVFESFLVSREPKRSSADASTAAATKKKGALKKGSKSSVSGTIGGASAASARSRGGAANGRGGGGGVIDADIDRPLPITALPMRDADWRSFSTVNEALAVENLREVYLFLRQEGIVLPIALADSLQRFAYRIQ